jgi:hypothetical protein
MLAKKFLRQTQHISSESSSTRYCRDHLYVYRLPFRFVIPHELISARSDVHPDFLKLCPSAKLGSTFLGPTTRKTYKQPITTYMIRIIRVQTEIVMASPIRCYDEREIIIKPYTIAAPPLQIEHFPREYKLCTTKALKQHMWNGSFAHLHVSAAEPPPLNVSTAAPRTSTFVSVKLALTPKLPCEMELRPREWKCVVKYCLRSRTFYSTQKMERIPTSSATKSDQFLRMREGKSAWETRGFWPISWRRDYLPEGGTPTQDERLCPWMTTLVLPVNASKDLLPTFLNCLSARQYALVVRLMIEGLHHGAIELVIPVQVIYCPAEAASPAVDAEIEPRDQDCGLSSMGRLAIQSVILSDDGDLDQFQERSFSPPPYDCI